MPARVSHPPEGPVRDLLAAVLEAIALPYPATVGDVDAYRALLEVRAGHARLALEHVLNQNRRPPADVVWDTAYLRERLADLPPTTYKHYPPAYPDDTGGGGQR